MKAKLFLFMLALMPMMVSAGSVNIDGIFYYLDTKNKEAQVAHYYEYTGKIEIPPSVQYQDVDYIVTSFEYAAFRDCANVTSITIPNTITIIGEYTFSGCTGLKSVTIPNSITSIGNGAFYGCTDLTSVTIPNSVTSIGISVFSGCTSLTNFVVENGNTVYDSRDNCDALIETKTNTLIYGCKSTIIPNSVTTIGNNAFSKCPGLISINIPNSVTTIGQGAFWGSQDLTSITIGNGVTTIEQSAFYDCTGLTSVILPNSVKSIGKWAFQRCSNLNTVFIPNSVTSIEEGAFGGCSSLSSITIPNSITTISNGVFSGCSNLTSVTIPNNVTSIGNNAFSHCTNLTSVTIPKSVTSIGWRVIEECEKLTDIYCFADILPEASNAFLNSNIGNATLHVPASSLTAYQAVAPWKNFERIVALGSTTPETYKCANPTIAYQNGKLTFNCTTEGATCQYTISDTDIKAGSGNELDLTATYNISVYATKSGYDNSDVVTATLCWIDVDQKPEDITGVTAKIPATPVLIQGQDGTITVRGLEDGTIVRVFDADGKQDGIAVSNQGVASIPTNIQSGSVAIVKIGLKSIKVVMK